MIIQRLIMGKDLSFVREIGNCVLIGKLNPLISGVYVHNVPGAGETVKEI